MWIQKFWLLRKPICIWQIRKLSKKIPRKEREAHIYLTWSTGSGKSSLLEQLIYYDWMHYISKNEQTTIVIDPHWDTVEKIRKFNLAKKYIDTYVYIDPRLSKWNTPTINPLECWSNDANEIEVKANQLVRAIQEMIPEAKLTNYMRAILKPCIYVLLTLKTCTFENLQEFMWDENEHRVSHWRKSTVQSYRKFFQTEFNKPIYKRTKQSIYTKIQSLLNSQVFYQLTCWRSTIDLEQQIRKGKLILLNLSKWKLGEEVTESIGRLLIAQVKSIALLRANLPKNLRKPIYLVIDEADTFIKWDSLNVILKETRKYGLHLCLATQSIVSWKEQEKLKRNLINQTNVKIIGRNGTPTLKALSQETMISIKELQKFWFYKPIIQLSIKPEEWVEDFPINLQEGIMNKHYPRPKTFI